ncbi:PREDICTED: coagulation factor IX-like, partial [Rhagoletis zephyria]|uniref:coagulation factor IX-like n=1 Tax=Rhagoletis zephyria TaxID=28612 RepID=UPI000811A511
MVLFVGFCKLLLLFKIIIITTDVAIAKNDPNCGIKGPKPIPDLLSSLNNFRIIGGEDALPGEFPWLCSLRSNNKHQCGGSIINSQFIVTAGHCIAPVYNDDNLEVVCGTNTISPSNTEVRAKVVKKFLHSHFVFPQNDIALLKLDHSLDLSLPRLGSVCLPEPNEPLSVLE